MSDLLEQELMSSVGDDGIPGFGLRSRATGTRDSSKKLPDEEKDLLEMVGSDGIPTNEKQKVKKPKAEKFEWMDSIVDSGPEQKIQEEDDVVAPAVAPVVTPTVAPAKTDVPAKVSVEPNAGKKKFLVIDPGGMHVETARQLGREGHDVVYYSPYHTAYAEFRNAGCGVGCPEIKKVLDFGSHIESVDCIVIPDVGMGDLADYFRSVGKPVFGGGKAEILEQDRRKCFEILDSVGVKYPKSHYVTGVTEAIKKCGEIIAQKSETNQMASGKCFVKVNVFRGDVDTFPVDNLETAQGMFDDMRVAFGPHAEDIEICVQETVNGFECGADLFFNGEKFVGPYMVGFEDGMDYVGKITDDLGFMKADCDKIATHLKASGYRGAFSFEGIWDGKDMYFIDLTMRYPMPLGMMYNEYANKLSDLIYEIANGTAESSRLPLNRHAPQIPIQWQPRRFSLRKL